MKKSISSRGLGESRKGTIRVLLAEPPGIHALLRQIEEVELLADVNYEKDLLRMISERHPHVILFTMHGGHLAGLPVVSRVVKRFPAVKAVIVGHSFTPGVRRACTPRRCFRTAVGSIHGTGDETGAERGSRW
jgi:hypothetical protein